MSIDDGWQWFDAPAAGAGEPDAAGAVEPNLAVAFTRCFSTPEGRQVLKHLRSVTLDRAAGPSVSDACLRHLEGQRQLVNHVLMLIAQGAGRL
ncbi:MAG: hypothetical protein U1E38_01680 [Rhodospirillales bacterium]